jgi:hypothetical protein
MEVMIMRTLKSLATLALLLAPPALAGGMVSSGGQLLRDANNPWWVRNTAQVRYCVEVDRKSISAAPARVEELVAEALRFWRGEFTRTLKMVNQKAALNARFNEAGVGIQEFRRTECTGAEDLRFQLGYDTLTAEQREFIPDLSSHVSAAVRTGYDVARLRARGFVYVASDLGPYKFVAGPETVSTPWKHDILLYLALVHELGHVFGLPHIGETYSLMSAQFLEMALSKPVAHSIQDLPVLGVPKGSFFFFPSNYFAHCSRDGFPERTAAFLELPPETRCLHFVVDGDEKRILVFAAPGIGAPKAYVGGIAELDLDAAVSLGITVYLSQKQAVFAPEPFLPRVAAGPMFVAKRGPGTFFPAAGAAKAVHVDLSSRAFNLASVLDGSIRTVLSAPVDVVPHY